MITAEHPVGTLEIENNMHIKIGDILVKGKLKCKVLEVGASGKTCFVSTIGAYDEGAFWDTFAELERDGWKVEGEQPFQKLTKAQAEEIKKRLPPEFYSEFSDNNGSIGVTDLLKFLDSMTE
jgi:hypothetical protein